MATTQDIQSWFAANPNATDQQIAAAMTHYGVSPTQIAQATGTPLDQVQTRFNAATTPTAVNAPSNYQYYQPGYIPGITGPAIDPNAVNTNQYLPDGSADPNYGKNLLNLVDPSTRAAFGTSTIGPNGYKTASVDPSTFNYGAYQSALNTLPGLEMSPSLLSQLQSGHGPSSVPAELSQFFGSGPSAYAGSADPASSAGGASYGTPISASQQAGVSNGDITNWLSQHPGASDQTIAQAMLQYGVSPQQMAGAIGADPNYIQSRYNAALGINPGVIDGGSGMLGGNGGAGSVGSSPLGSLGGVGSSLGGSSTSLGGGQLGGTASGGSANGLPGGGAFGPVGGYGYFGTQGNPYLDAMAGNIQRQTQLGLNDAFSQIRGNAVANGNLGGSRQGVAQGVATARAMDSLQGNLGNLYGGAFDSQMNRGLQQYGVDTNAYLGNQGQQMNYGLGLGQQALTNQGQMLDFYSTQRAQDQNGVALGAQLYGMGQQQAWAPYQNASNIYGQFGGFGTQTGSQSQGGGAVGAVGGALGTAQLMNNLNNPNYGGYGLGLGGNYGLKF